MKKHFLSYLAIILLAFTLTGCDNLMGLIGGGGKDPYVSLDYSKKPTKDFYDFGETVEIEVTTDANAAGSTSYQWYKYEYGKAYSTATPISGATSEKLTLKDINQESDYNYFCRATNKILTKEAKDETTSVRVKFTMIRYIDGYINEDYTCDTKYTYVVKSNAVFKNSAKLEIPAGITIKFETENGYIRFDDESTIEATGTQEAPIIFTSSKATPAAGSWNNIEIDGTQGSKFEWCVFEYGKEVLLLKKKTTVTNCVFKDNKSSATEGALIIGNGAYESTVKNNTFYNNVCPISMPGYFTIGEGNVFHKDNLVNSKPYIYTRDDYIDVPVTYTVTEIPYLLDYTLIPRSNGVLTINEGVTIQFFRQDGYIRTDDEGAIIANGTEENPVTFTSAKATPAAGDWKEIELNGNGGATFTYCIFEYGTNPLKIKTDATVTNCTFKDNKCNSSSDEFFGALMVENGGWESEVDNNLFYNNSGCPISCPAFFTVGEGNVFHKDDLKNTRQFIFVHDDYIDVPVTYAITEIPYVCQDGNIVVRENGALTVKDSEGGDPVIFKFRGGHLRNEDNGVTELNDAIFTSYKDDAHGGDSNLIDTAPATGDWEGIKLDDVWLTGPKIFYAENHN